MSNLIHQLTDDLWSKFSGNGMPLAVELTHAPMFFHLQPGLIGLGLVCVPALLTTLIPVEQAMFGGNRGLQLNSWYAFLVGIATIIAVVGFAKQTRFLHRSFARLDTRTKPSITDSVTSEHTEPDQVISHENEDDSRAIK